MLGWYFWAFLLGFVCLWYFWGFLLGFFGSSVVFGFEPKGGWFFLRVVPSCLYYLVESCPFFLGGIAGVCFRLVLVLILVFPVISVVFLVSGFVFFISWVVVFLGWVLVLVFSWCACVAGVVLLSAFFPALVFGLGVGASATGSHFLGLLSVLVTVSLAGSEASASRSWGTWSVVLVVLPVISPIVYWFRVSLAPLWLSWCSVHLFIPW